MSNTCENETLYKPYENHVIVIGCHGQGAEISFTHQYPVLGPLTMKKLQGFISTATILEALDVSH